MVSNTVIALGIGTIGAGAYAVESGALEGQESEKKKEKKPNGANNGIVPGLAVGRSGGSPPSNYNSPTITKKKVVTNTEGPDVEKNYNIQTNSPGAGGISNDGGNSSGGSENSDGGSKKDVKSSGSSGGGSGSDIDLSNVEPENEFSKKEMKEINESTPQPGDSPDEVTRTLNQNQGYTRTQTTAEMDNPPSLDVGNGSDSGGSSSKKEEKADSEGSSGDSGGGIIDDIAGAIGW